MNVINMKHYRMLQEGEKLLTADKLAKFQEIKDKILYNGYKDNYDAYKVTKEQQC